VALLAMGMTFDLALSPHRAQQNPSQQDSSAKQDSAPRQSAIINSADSGQGSNRHAEMSEFWSAKLTDWLLAAFTFFLVLFTYRLWKSTDKLWLATIEAMSLGQREYISNHRPRISVRMFELREPGQIGPIRVGFRIINSGESTAHLMSVNSTVLYKHTELPGVPPYDAAKTEIYTHTLMASGQFMEIAGATDVSVDEFELAFLSERALMICGFVSYCDDHGVVRQMGFGRSHDGHGSFRRIDNEEYNYND
jgi:hypothetical protein